MVNKIAIISTHPIQYYAPVFAKIAETLNVKVFYTLGLGNENKFDRGFGKNIKWDIPLLEGYKNEFLKNTSKNPGSHHFNGIYNPDLIVKIQEFAPTKILIYGWAYKSHVKLIRHFYRKIPIYFRGDSTILNQSNGIKSIVKKIYLSWLYRHIDKAFYVGTANKDYFKYYGLSENQLIFAPHAIDNKRFAENRSQEAMLLRSTFQISNDAVLILFAGKFDLVKSPELLLNAFFKLKLPNVHLMFVGNGVLENELKAKSKMLKAKSAYIHFLDFQNQSKMPVVYQACDLFCLPSKRESWGLAINEAMATGKAILASDKVGCAADLVKNGLNGAVFKSGNEQDLLDKLVSLCKDKQLLKSYGKSSLNMIEQWSFNKQVAIIAAELDKNATSK